MAVSGPEGATAVPVEAAQALAGPKSWAALACVWLVGLVGEIAAYRMVEDPDLVVTAPALLVGVLFLSAPLFLVVYMLVWSWPWAVRRSKGVRVGQMVFCVTTEVVALYVADAAPKLSLRAAMRILAVLNPMFFVAYAAIRECVARPREKRQMQFRVGDPA
jgi:hypothetical protein